MRSDEKTARHLTNLQRHCLSCMTSWCFVLSAALRGGGARGAAAPGQAVLGPTIGGSGIFLCADIGL